MHSYWRWSRRCNHCTKCRCRHLSRRHQNRRKARGWCLQRQSARLLSDSCAGQPMRRESAYSGRQEFCIGSRLMRATVSGGRRGATLARLRLHQQRCRLPGPGDGEAAELSGGSTAIHGLSLCYMRQNRGSPHLDNFVGKFLVCESPSEGLEISCRHLTMAKSAEEALQGRVIRRATRLLEQAAQVCQS